MCHLQCAICGGAILPGDTLEYSVTLANTGNDTAAQTVLSDLLPAGVTYVPNSITVVSGPNSGGKTDAPGDDQAEYTTASRSLSIRLGTDANAAQGGKLAMGGTTTISFRVTVDPTCTGPSAIANQATITALGLVGGTTSTFVTDGDASLPGSQPTTITVDVRCLTLQTSGPGSGTVASTATGSTCGASCTAVFPAGTQVTLTATADTDSTFTGWSGDVSGTDNPLVLSLNSTASVTATFIQKTYTVTTTAGAHGSISPNTVQTVTYGSTQLFTITPDSGYQVADVLIDGSSIGPVTSYTFTNVTANHTIEATFVALPPNSYTVTPTAGAHGSISPNTVQTVTYGSTQLFTITPDSGYQVADALIDGSSIGPVTTYMFTNVTANHTIVVSFASQDAPTYRIALPLVIGP